MGNHFDPRGGACPLPQAPPACVDSAISSEVPDQGQYTLSAPILPLHSQPVVLWGTDRFTHI